VNKLLFLPLFLFPGLLAAKEPVVSTFDYPIAGVVCSACANSVKKSIQHVPGVVAVKIHRTSEGALPVLSVTAVRDSLTAKELRTALGKDKSHFQIGELSPKDGGSK
jgi:copper chaperone CopZ